MYSHILVQQTSVTLSSYFGHKKATKQVEIYILEFQVKSLLYKQAGSIVVTP